MHAVFGDVVGCWLWSLFYVFAVVAAFCFGCSCHFDVCSVVVVVVVVAVVVVVV